LIKSQWLEYGEEDWEILIFFFFYSYLRVIMERKYEWNEDFFKQREEYTIFHISVYNRDMIFLFF